MMIGFSHVSTVWQCILLVISQFSVITLVAGFILLFKRKAKLGKLIGFGAILMLNVVLYVLMQLDSRITGAEKDLLVHVPYILLFIVTLLTVGIGAYIVIGETTHRKTVNQTSIKEAFDTLPTGVCFFNRAGLPVLCNHAMHRFSFAVCERDVQYITDLEECLADDFTPANNVKRDGSSFVMPDGNVKYLKRSTVTQEDGSAYIQFIAMDITELYENRAELQEQNAQLRRAQAELKRLSANMVSITREEEILNTKMRVHDEMGRCLMAAQRYLRSDSDEGIPDSVATAWQRAVSSLKYNNDTNDEDMLAQIRKTCDFVKVSFLQKGELPKDDDVAYLLSCAVRECLTNAVRYAEATELHADFSETQTEATVVIYNNGKVPEGQIKEGGGLSTLRSRIEREGGRMNVQSLPVFRLTVTLPKGKEGVVL